MDQPFTQIVAWNESLLDEDQLINVLVFFLDLLDTPNFSILHCKHRKILNELKPDIF